MSPRAPGREEACEGGLRSGSQQACASPWCFTVAVKGAVSGTRSEEWAQSPAAVAAAMQLCEAKGRREKWEVDSCFGGENRRSLCVLPRKICDQLSVSVSEGAIMETLWVGAQRGCIRGSCGRTRWWWWWWSAVEYLSFSVSVRNFLRLLINRRKGR